MSRTVEQELSIRCVARLYALCFVQLCGFMSSWFKKVQLCYTAQECDATPRSFGG